MFGNNEKNQIFTEKKNKDGEKVKFPKYKYPSKIGIQNMIYHLKDENDCEYWQYVSNPKTLENKAELKKRMKELSATAFSYIADGIRTSINSKFNSNIRKGKKYHPLSIDGIEEVDFTGIHFYRFNSMDCKISFQIQRRSALKVISGKNAKFNVPKIGLVKMVYHRPIPENSKFDQVTISKKNDEYYISLCGLNISEEPMKNDIVKTVGIDINTDNYIVSSDGQTWCNPASKLLKLKKRIKRLQKRNGENKKDAKCKSKRDYKSNNYRKNLLKQNKIFNKINNIKKHIINNMASYLSKNYDLITMEDLNVKGMQKYNGSMVQKNNFYEIKRQLEYKTLLNGSIFNQVDRFFPSSQVCSKCGQIHPEMKKLTKRVFRCDCGNIIARDLNAAININNEGLKNFLENNKKVLDK